MDFLNVSLGTTIEDRLGDFTVDAQATLDNLEAFSRASQYNLENADTIKLYHLEDSEILTIISDLHLSLPPDVNQLFQVLTLARNVDQLIINGDLFDGTDSLEKILNNQIYSTFFEALFKIKSPEYDSIFDSHSTLSFRQIWDEFMNANVNSIAECNVSLVIGNHDADHRFNRRVSDKSKLFYTEEFLNKFKYIADVFIVEQSDQTFWIEHGDRGKYKVEKTRRRDANYYHNIYTKLWENLGNTIKDKFQIAAVRILIEKIQEHYSFAEETLMIQMQQEDFVENPCLTIVNSHSHKPSLPNPLETRKRANTGSFLSGTKQGNYLQITNGELELKNRSELGY